jgi:hypothetical protein
VGPAPGPYKLHVEAWGLYRQFFDRFNFANHTYDTGSFGGHISAEVIPQTLELQVYGAHGALGRFTAAPCPDATLAQDGTILPLSVTSALVGVVWHTLPTLDIYSYAGLEKVDAAFRNAGTVPFGYGNPLDNNTGCNIENSPAATCNGNTSEVRQYTVGFYDTIMRGSYGTVKAGVQYSYNQRFAFAGVGGAPKTDDNIVMTRSGTIPSETAGSIDVKAKRRNQRGAGAQPDRRRRGTRRLCGGGAMCGTFVAAQLTRLNPALFDSIGFIAATVLVGMIGFYLGIDVPRLRASLASPAIARPRVDPIQLLSASGTFLATVAGSPKSRRQGRRITLTPASPGARAGGRSRARPNPGRSRRYRDGWRGCG